MNLTARLTRLEGRAADLPKTMHAKDAADFKSEIIRIAKQFEEPDQFIPALERSARFSKAMELAWQMRFGTVGEFADALKQAVQYAEKRMQ